MLKAFNAYIKPANIRLRNTLENRKQILVHYYPTEVKGRVYDADYFNGKEIYFADLGETTWKPF